MAADPRAVYVSNLFGKMNYQDQKWANSFRRYSMTLFGIIGYLAGWYFAQFSVTLVALATGTFLNIIVTVPNWRQRPEPQEDSWLPKDITASYYDELDDLENTKAQEAEAQATGAKKLFLKIPGCGNAVRHKKK